MSKPVITHDEWLRAIKEAPVGEDKRLLLLFRDEVEEEFRDEHAYLVLFAFACGIFIHWVFS